MTTLESATLLIEGNVGPTPAIKLYLSLPRYVQFGEGNNLTSMASGQVPPSLHEKFTLLRYFAQYMDENLTEGGEGGKLKTGGGAGAARPSSPTFAIPQIKRWIRAPKAIIMHLTNGTIQVRCPARLAGCDTANSFLSLSGLSCLKAADNGQNNTEHYLLGEPAVDSHH